MHDRAWPQVVYLVTQEYPQEYHNFIHNHLKIKGIIFKAHRKHACSKQNTFYLFLVRAKTVFLKLIPNRKGTQILSPTLQS